MIKKIVIVGSGRLSEVFLKDIKEGDHTIGVDRGAAWLLSHNVKPDAAIGDFDSVTKKELARIKKLVKHVEFHPTDKDFTDMELAVTYAIKRKPKEVVIYGGIGTRADHVMGTLYLLEHFLNAGIAARIVDETNDITLISGRRTIKKGKGYRYVSMLPYTNSVTVTLERLRYNVARLTLVRGATRGISNELTGRKATIRLFTGKAWVIESND